MDPGPSRAVGERSVSVGGDVIDSLIVTGDNNNFNLVLGSRSGAVIEQLARAARPSKSLRPPPVRSVPPALRNSVDREDEARAILDGAAPGAPVNVVGPRGVGKTYALLRGLNQEHPALGGGAVYVYAPGPLDDVLQLLFEECYDCEPPLKPSTSQLRRDLSAVRGLIALDSVDLERDAAQQLTFALPGCAVVIASRERVLWEGTPIAVHGLQGDHAVAVVEQELGRPLRPGEAGPVRLICTALDGHPLRLRETIATAREAGRSLGDLARELDGPDPGAALVRDKLEAAGDQGRRLLASLALFGEAAVGQEHLRAIADVPDFDAALSATLRRRDVQAHSPRYNIGTTLSSAKLDTEPAGERALVHFTGWAEEMRADPSALLGEAPAILALLRWARDSGRVGPAIRLGRAVDHAFALGRRFGAWAEVLEIVLAAARAGEDLDAQAWAIHQLGTRAICLGDLATGSAMLAEAIRLRRELGDDAAAERSAQNLAIARRPNWFTRWVIGHTILLALAIVALVGAVGVIALTGGNGHGSTNSSFNGPPVAGRTSSTTTTSTSTGSTSTTSTGTSSTTTSTTSHAKGGGGGTGGGGTIGGRAAKPKLSVTVLGTGVVAAAQGGTPCRGSCILHFAKDVRVTLTATAAGGLVFAAWHGDCSGVNPICTVTMHGDHRVTAQFTAPAELIVIVRKGPSVLSKPVGIDGPNGTGCSMVCNAFFAPNTTVQLTASAAAFWTAPGCAAFAPPPPPPAGSASTSTPSSSSPASTPSTGSDTCSVTLQNQITSVHVTSAPG